MSTQVKDDIPTIGEILKTIPTNGEQTPEPEKPSKMRKPTKVLSIPERKKLILARLPDHNGIVQYAINQLRSEGYVIDRNWFYRQKRRDSKFAAKVEDMQEVTIAHVETKLYDLIEAGQPSAIIFYLKSRSKEYKPKMDMDITNIKELNKTQKEAILKEIQGEK